MHKQKQLNIQFKRSKQYQAIRKFSRWLHIVIAGYQLIYIYTPLHNWQYALPIVQWVTFPLLFLSGLWLWKGQKIWHYHSAKKAANENKRKPILVQKAA